MPVAPTGRPTRRIALGLCAILCLTYATLSWCAARQKSATFDEPFHVALGWLMLHDGDFRAAPDVQPLWEYWLGLPLGSSGLRPNPTDPEFLARKTSSTTFNLLFNMIYRTPGVDPIAVVRRARMMSVIPAVLLGVLVARWSWALAGPVAAVSATLLWAMDPSMLGHGSLAKNDVAFALVYAWLAYSMWRAGQRLSWPWIVSLCLSVGLAVETKLSGLVTGPLLALVLLARAWMPEPWPVLGWVLRTRRARVGAAVAVCVAAALSCYVVIWSAYRFRYEAAPDGKQIDLDATIAALCRLQTAQADDYRLPASGQWGTLKPDLPTTALQWVAEHRFMPQAWIAGVLQTRREAIATNSFLCGNIYRDGRWYYFPVALALKEPLATLALLLVALAMWLLTLRRRIFHPGGGHFFSVDWATLAVFIPLGVYGGCALLSPMNLGVRYIFPMYPFLFVSGGLCAAQLWRIGLPARVALAVAALGLVGESTAAFPNYIAFFNLAGGGSRGGLSLLGESNLDWGQDLPLLAQWQRSHPVEPLYLSYFGTCDPAAYGIRYMNVPGGYLFGPPPQWPKSSGVAAISATNLQGIYFHKPGGGGESTFADSFVGREPFAVLGGTIYLFRVETLPPPTRQASESPASPQSPLP